MNRLLLAASIVLTLGLSGADSPPEKMVEIKGIVVGPDGKPVAGARLALASTERDFIPGPGASSGPDGRFLLRVPGLSLKAGVFLSDRSPCLVASAEGFGPGRAGAGFEFEGDSRVELAEEGTPIEGRVVDLEGRPVAGARVEVRRVLAVEKGDLGGWLAEYSREGTGRLPVAGLTTIPVAVETKTGADGTFRLVGIGRDRVAVMAISGHSIATEVVHAMTRPGPEATVDAYNANPFLRTTRVSYHPPRFDLVVAPTKPIRGVIRDTETGRPIGGLGVDAAVLDKRTGFLSETVEVMTDAEGRYLLVGLPAAKTYRIQTRQALGQFSPYPDATFETPATNRGVDPVEFDFALKRGVVARGRVTDKVTGLPVAGRINAYTFLDNSTIAEFPGYDAHRPTTTMLDEDGRYELALPSGRNLVTCQSDQSRYRRGFGSEAIPKGGFGLLNIPQMTDPTYDHALAVAVLDPSADPATMDLQVDPGRTVEVTVVDPDGRPVGGCRVEGAFEAPGLIASPPGSSKFEVRSLVPGRRRRVIAWHDARKLVGTIVLTLNEGVPMTIHLQPWAEISGRVVDADGKPARGYSIYDSFSFARGQVETISLLAGTAGPGGIKVGDDGRFQIVGLIPGERYIGGFSDGRYRRQRPGSNPGGSLVLKPGEIRDLGNCSVTTGIH